MKGSAGFNFVVVVLLLVLYPVALLAQPGPPPDPDVPITGIEFLVAGGALLGIRRLLGKKKNK